MILDTIFNAKQYQNIHPGIAKILEAVTQYTEDHYPVGRITLDGENLYMNLEEYQTHSKEDGAAEAHQNYIDVMYMVEGTETIYVKSVQSLRNIRKGYNPEKDLLLADIDEDTNRIRLEKGMFLILFPQDAHAPGCNTELSGRVKKIVGKIRIMPNKEDEE